MSRTLLALVLLALLLAAAPVLSETAATKRRMALTFDDLPAPGIEKLPDERVKALNAGILAALEARKAPAIGFVNEGKLEQDGELITWRVELLEAWLDGGHALGNHGFAHLDLHKVTLAAYQEDILNGHQVIKALLAGRQLPLRYFRHPYLHTGLDLRTKKAVERFLAGHHYQVAPVTIDNAEWVAAAAYEAAIARGDAALQAKVAAAYLDYMMAMVEYYEGQSRALFQREIPQVLLLHANALNGDHVAALLARIEARGYAFITLEEALKDEAYREPDTYTGPGGITWLHRWALTRKVDKAMFATEPVLPAFVTELAGVEP